MAKQILVGIREQDLNEVAHYLMIYLPFNEELTEHIACYWRYIEYYNYCDVMDRSLQCKWLFKEDAVRNPNHCRPANSACLKLSIYNEKVL